MKYLFTIQNICIYYVILVPWADRSAPSVEGCSAKSLDQMSTSNDQQKINVKTKRKATIKFQHLHKYNATTLCNICIAYSSTNILQRSKYLQSCLGLGILLCSKLLWFFFFKNLLFWWQALDGVLVEPPEMGLLGNSGKKVTNDCIALIHLHIQPIYLSNIFVLCYTSTFSRYICQIFLCYSEPASHLPDIFVEKFCIALIE